VTVCPILIRFRTRTDSIVLNRLQLHLLTQRKIELHQQFVGLSPFRIDQILPCLGFLKQKKLHIQVNQPGCIDFHRIIVNQVKKGVGPMVITLIQDHRAVQKSNRLIGQVKQQIISDVLQSKQTIRSGTDVTEAKKTLHISHGQIVRSLQIRDRVLERSIQHHLGECLRLILLITCAEVVCPEHTTSQGQRIYMTSCGECILKEPHGIVLIVVHNGLSEVQ